MQEHAELPKVVTQVAIMPPGTCQLEGRVHFDVLERSESLRLLVEGEEICRSEQRAVINVAGLLVLAFVGPRSAAEHPEVAGTSPWTDLFTFAQILVNYMYIVKMSENKRPGRDR